MNLWLIEIAYFLRRFYEYYIPHHKTLYYIRSGVSLKK